VGLLLAVRRRRDLQRMLLIAILPNYTCAILTKNRSWSTTFACERLPTKLRPNRSNGEGPPLPEHLFRPPYFGNV